VRSETYAAVSPVVTDGKTAERNWGGGSTAVLNAMMGTLPFRNPDRQDTYPESFYQLAVNP
jgi:hypothetical protein